MTSSRVYAYMGGTTADYVSQDYLREILEQLKEINGQLRLLVKEASSTTAAR